jgi:hypothetical protein
MRELSITTQYDDKLCEFNGFGMRRFLLPHIGNKITETNGVLFIMESHYTDPTFFESQKEEGNLKLEAPKLFYEIKEEGLTKDFKAYLNTRQIIKESESCDRKLSKGKSVYRKLSSVIKEGFKLQLDGNDSALDYVAIYNYFQRPSYKPGASIVTCKKDEEVAYETLKHILSTVNIQKIIFTSAKAYDCFYKMDKENNGQLHSNRQIFRGTHPRVWGNACTYDKSIKWKQWIINRLVC